MSRIFGKATALVAAIAALAICIGTLAGGISLHKHTANQNKTYTGTVDAVVADYDVRQEEFTSTDSDNITTTTIQDMYYPIFEYTVDGQDYQIVSDTGYGKEKYELGSTVKINYLPEDPTQYYVSGDSSRNWLPYILYAVSLVALVVSVRTFLPLIRR